MQMFLEIVFWISALVVFYTYAGYPIYLYIRQVWRAQPVYKADDLKFVSIIIAVRNEEAYLERKIQLLERLNYPRSRCEIIVASDGSSDGTNEILEKNASELFHPVVLTEHRGKAAALNEAVKRSSGEILVFMDARQALHPDSLRNLVRSFADTEVGCVSGELMLGSAQQTQGSDPGLYWRVEKLVRKLESQTGSVIGATGALYAVRRELVPILPVGTILDDVYIPMHVIRAGRRVIFESSAIAWDEPSTTQRHELRRKVRTLMGNYQLLRLAPWIITPQNPMRFEFISHKLLRLLVPFALIALLVTSAVLPIGIFRLALFAQVAFYLLAILAPFIRLRAARAAFTFLMLNLAAAIAFLNVVTGRKAAWGAVTSQSKVVSR